MFQELLILQNHLSDQYIRKLGRINIASKQHMYFSFKSV